MNNKTKETEQHYGNRNSVPILAPGIGTRIDAASKLIGTRAEAAKAAGISDDMLYRYIREESPPSFKAMARLMKAAGKSLDWLATGEEIQLQKHTVAEDIELLTVCLREVEQVLLDAGRTLSPDNKAELVATLYEIFRESGTEPTQRLVLSLVKSAM